MKVAMDYVARRAAGKKKEHLESLADVLGHEGCAGYGVERGQPLEASKGVQAANPKS